MWSSGRRQVLDAAAQIPRATRSPAIMKFYSLFSRQHWSKRIAEK
jgi:hypothetical protein